MTIARLRLILSLVALAWAGCCWSASVKADETQRAKVETCADEPAKKKDEKKETAESCERKPSSVKKKTKKKKDKKTEEKKSEEKKPDAEGACVIYQFMGGESCEEMTKRQCYDRFVNVLEWREGLTCFVAAFAPPLQQGTTARTR